MLLLLLIITIIIIIIIVSRKKDTLATLYKTASQYQYSSIILKTTCYLFYLFINDAISAAGLSKRAGENKGIIIF